ncbi:hypothetical protein [Cellulosimicrobium cellulans]|uniref:AMIN-like domain-containing (lipo)protein n=1 Tax=Cellulosimicrobium cellulans TaxID=1710 RepID=UPI00130D72BD|nr:hypothetical protein [Cellulosimicrobium cellulans]
MTRTRTSARRPLLAGSAVALLALVAACGGTDDAPTGDASTTAAPPATTSPATTPSPTATATGDATDADADAAAPAFPGDTAADTADASADAALTVTDVRVGHHDGYDRVVFELGGTGTPGWRVEYVDAAVEDPTGETVDVAGDSPLQVVLTGTAYPTDTGLTEFPLRQPVTAAGTTAVTEAVLLGTFEAQTQAFVGVTGEPRPFRAYLLPDPVRVVVDVQQ